MNHILIQKNSIENQYDGITKKIYLFVTWKINYNDYLIDIFKEWYSYTNLSDLIDTCKLLPKNTLNKLNIEVSDNNIKITNDNTLTISLYHTKKDGEIILTENETKNYLYSISNFKNIHKCDLIKNEIMNIVKQIYHKVYYKYFIS